MTYMTGAGVCALLNMARLMNYAGGLSPVQGPSGQPREIFYAFGINALIPSTDSL